MKGGALVLALSAALVAGGPALAEDGAAVPGVLSPAAAAVDVDERLGAAVPGDLRFTDSSGRRLLLSEVFAAGKPTLLVLAYYRCPMLCGLVLRGAADALREVGWKPGDRVEALTVSFDPKDGLEDAARTRDTILSRAGAPDGRWTFAVGDEDAVRRLADAVGFRYAYDERTDQYAHPAVTVVLTPDGRISRYLYGVQVAPLDLRMALLEAAEGRVGTLIDRLILTCYRYDPASRKYMPYVLGYFRIGAACIAMLVGALVSGLWRLERRRRRALGDGGPPRAGGSRHE